MILTWMILVAGCGGAATASGGGGTTGTRDGDGTGDRPSWTARATAALGAGDLEAAERASANALQLDPGDAAAAIVAARVALAGGDSARTIEVLADAHAPPGVRLRARARVMAGDWAGAARDLASVDGREPEDGWANAMLPLARTVAERCADPCRTHRASGPERAALPFVGRGALPVVEVSLDGQTVNALVASSADSTIVSRSLRAQPGLVARLGLGSIVVEDVPVMSRDLAPIGRSLGLELGMVIGLDLLTRLHATLDARERWLVVRTSGSEAAAEAASVPYRTLDGGFLVVRGELADHDVGWLAVDTAGGFPLALVERTVRLLGHDPATLPAVEGAPSDRIREVPPLTVRLGEVQIEDVPALAGLVPPDLAEVAGTPLAGIVGMHLLSAAKVTFDPDGRRLRFE